MGVGGKEDMEEDTFDVMEWKRMEEDLEMEELAKYEEMFDHLWHMETVSEALEKLSLDGVHPCPTAGVVTELVESLFLSSWLSILEEEWDRRVQDSRLRLTNPHHHPPIQVLNDSGFSEV